MVRSFLFQRHEPAVDVVNPGDIFVKQRLVGVSVDVRSAVPSLEVSDDLVKLGNLGVHNSQVAHQPYLLHIKTALWQQLLILICLLPSPSLTKVNSGAG